MIEYYLPRERAGMSTFRFLKKRGGPFGFIRHCRIPLRALRGCWNGIGPDPFASVHS